MVIELLFVYIGYVHNLSYPIFSVHKDEITMKIIYNINAFLSHW